MGGESPVNLSTSSSMRSFLFYFPHKQRFFFVAVALVLRGAVLVANGQANVNCAPQREAFMAYIARKGAEGPAKTKQKAPAEAVTDDPAQTMSGETWPVEEQQGWSEKGWEQNFETSGNGRESGTEGKSRW